MKYTIQVTEENPFEHVDVLHESSRTREKAELKTVSDIGPATIIVVVNYIKFTDDEEKSTWTWEGFGCTSKDSQPTGPTLRGTFLKNGGEIEIVS